MASKQPIAVKLAAGLLSISALRALIGGATMVWRFGALWDAAFFAGLASCLLLLALGVLRSKVNTLALSVAVLLTISAHLMSDAAPILKYGLAEPVRWLPMSLGCAVSVTALLLGVTPSVHRWFAGQQTD
jgi:hypothetical protein